MKLCMGCMEQYKDECDICPYCGHEENSLPDESFHLLPGTVLVNRYIVGKVLGFGGFGVTYIGYDRELQNKVAIKEYLPSEFATRMSHHANVIIYTGDKKEQYESGLTGFIEEARKLAKFSGDNAIVTVYDAFPENGTAYIVMEYLEGETLKQMLERRGKISVEETEKIILPIYYSLKAVHETGMIHGDIAPDNIFITKSGKVKLLDFGAARQMSAAHSRSLAVINRPGFAPPEQYQGKGEQGAWTDVYALAATMYRCITGITPEPAHERRNADALRSPSQRGIFLPKEKEAALMHALSLDVAGRTKTTREFLDEWQGLVVKPPQKKKKTKLIIGLVAAVWSVVVLGLGAFFLLGEDIFNKPSNNETVTSSEVHVPSLINKAFLEAELLAEAAGIKLVQEEVKYDASIEKGKVIFQSIEAGKVVSTGTTVKVVVSGGVKQIYMPQVIGEAVDTAKKILEDEGFDVNIIEEYSVYAEGTVYKADIASGTSCEDGSPVTVYVSKGIDLSAIVVPEEQKEYVVSNYLNMGEEELRVLLSEEGIALRCEQEESEDEKKGLVVGQITEEGTKLVTGDVVEVVIGMGIPMVNVGDLIGRKLSDVSVNLKTAGIIVIPHPEYSDTYAEGIIISAKAENDEVITDGMQLKKGTEIIVVVSEGPKPTSTPTPKPTSTPKPTTTPKPTNTPTPKPKPTKPPAPKPKPTKKPVPTPDPCVHNWYGENTCTERRICVLCGKSDGKAPGHKYKRHELQCSNCDYIRGEWSEWISNGTYKVEEKDDVQVKKESVDEPIMHYKYFRYVYYVGDVKIISFSKPEGYKKETAKKVKKGSKNYLYEETPELAAPLSLQAQDELGGSNGYLYAGKAYPAGAEISYPKSVKVVYYSYRKLILYDE